MSTENGVLLTLRDSFLDCEVIPGEVRSRTKTFNMLSDFWGFCGDAMVHFDDGVVLKKEVVVAGIIRSIKMGDLICMWEDDIHKSLFSIKIGVKVFAELDTKLLSPEYYATKYPAPLDTKQRVRDILNITRSLYMSTIDENLLVLEKRDL